MNKIYYSIIVGLSMMCSVNNVKAQIITIPDTVAIGSTHTLDLSTDTRFTTYTWAINNDNIDPIFEGHTQVNGTGTVSNRFNVSSQSTMVFDTLSGNFYGFVNSAGLSTYASIQRLDFGSNPNSTPTVTDLGNPLGLLTDIYYKNMEAIEFVLDDDGIFHAFVTNGGIIHYRFGNGINNPPTTGLRIYDHSDLQMPMQLTVKKVDKEWVLFFGNAYGVNKIMRLDLGEDLNDIPTSLTRVDLPGVMTSGFPGNPSYFSIIKIGANWHMIVTLSFAEQTQYRYDFGTNLRNNFPSVSAYTLDETIDSRGANFIRNFDSFYLPIIEESGAFKCLDFNNIITSIPTFESLGVPVSSTGNGYQVLKPYWHNDTLWALTSTWASNSISNVSRVSMTTLSATGDVISKYYSPKASYTFSTIGEQTITLFCDQGDPAGPEVFQKKVYVTQSVQNIADIGNEMSKSLSLYPNPSKDELHISFVSNKTNVIGSWSITDIAGRTILSGNSHTKTRAQEDYQQTVDIHTLQSGVYIMSLDIDGVKVSKKFTKM